jgi:hypothetical protein
VIAPPSRGEVEQLNVEPVRDHEEGVRMGSRDGTICLSASFWIQTCC